MNIVLKMGAPIKDLKLNKKWKFYIWYNEYHEKFQFLFLTYKLQYTAEQIPIHHQLSCSKALSSSLVGCKGATTPFWWFSASELVDGFAPFVIIFFNQEAWNLGDPSPLLELLGDSGPVLTLLVTLLVTPKRNLYATLLADTISVLACRNCNNHVILLVQQEHPPSDETIPRNNITQCYKTVNFEIYSSLLTRTAVFPATSIAVSPALANLLTQPVMEWKLWEYRSNDSQHGSMLKS